VPNLSAKAPAFIRQAATPLLPRVDGVGYTKGKTATHGGRGTASGTRVHGCGRAWLRVRHLSPAASRDSSRTRTGAVRGGGGPGPGRSLARDCPPARIACLPAPCRLSLHLSRVAAVGQWEILNLRLSHRENPRDYPPPPYKLTVSTYIVSFLPLTGLHFILHFLPTYDFTLSWLAIWKT
jgi:hypothetical protein